MSAPGRPAAESSRGGVEGLPRALVLQLADLGVDPEELHEPARGGRARPVRHLLGPDVVVDLATDAHGQHLNRLEAHGRAWAREHGVPVPRLRHSHPDGRWLVGERVRVPARAPSGADYLGAALEQAARIGRSPLSADRPAATTWRAPRRTRPARTARLVRRTGAMPLTMLRVRRAVQALPSSTTAHGDFYFRNVLAPGPGLRVLVVDWEYLGPAPAGTDALRLWSTTKEADGRDWLLDRVLSPLSRSARADASLLAYWLSLRLVAENLSAPVAEQRPEDAEHARRLLPQARALARRHGGWPRR